MDTLFKLPEVVREGLVPIHLEMEKEMNEVGLKAPELLHLDFRTSIIGKSDNMVDFTQMKNYFQKLKQEKMVRTIETMERIAELEQCCYYYKKTPHALMLDFRNEESIFYVVDEELEICEKDKEADDKKFFQLLAKEGFEKEAKEIELKMVFSPKEIGEDKYRLMYKITTKYSNEIRSLEAELMSYAKKVVEKAQVQLDKRNKKMENAIF